MDSPAESTSVKNCIFMKGGRKRPLECIREFQLQQQFPSTMKQVLKNGINTDQPIALNLMCPDNIRASPNAENQVPYNLQKLRILSSDGRDLGEFNVQLKSNDLSKGNTITITKSNIKAIDKPLTLPLTPISHMKVLPRILKQGSRKIPKRNLMEAMSCSRSVSSTDNGSMSYQQEFIILPMNKMILNNQGTESKMEKQICNNDSINTDKVSVMGGINSKRSACQTVGNQKYIVHHETDDMDICNNANIREATAGNNEISLATETPLYKEYRTFPWPTNSKRLAINFSDKNNISLSGKSLNVSKGKCIATIRNTESGKIVTSLKSAADLVPRYNQINKNLNHNDLYNNSRKNLNSDQVLHDENLLLTESDIIPESQMPEIKAQNVMTIIPSNKTLLFDQNAGLAQKNNTPVTLASIKNTSNAVNYDDTIKHNTKCDNIWTKNSQVRSRNEHLIVIDHHLKRISKPQQTTDIGASVQNKSLPQKDLSCRLNIIKKAMDSVRDNELRELALKALADCGIGIERYVPIHPPAHHKAVHDTQVQTVVFGLLDPKSFIFINKDLEDVHRLNQITLHDSGELLVDNLHFNNNVTSKDSSIIEEESPFDLDSFLEQFWKKDSDAFKMKETLSKTSIRCNNLLEHLQRDFECVKRYDQNGMLNIHNAVVSNNVSLVRRQLMILEYCKQSTDILTEDGMTSLELAIEYDVCSEIVELLLRAGAQPVIAKSIRESAVIIASKQSSPLLSMLVSRVSNSKLLDHIDSNGLAAIHYCSIHGNLQGVKALISAGATIDLKDMKSGRTSLFHAIDNNHTSVMQALLKAGAVANIVNYAGQTALSVITDPKSMAFKISLKKDIT